MIVCVYVRACVRACTCARVFEGGSLGRGSRTEGTGAGRRVAGNLSLSFSIGVMRAQDLYRSWGGIEGCKGMRRRDACRVILHSAARLAGRGGGARGGLSFLVEAGGGPVYDHAKAFGLAPVRAGALVLLSLCIGVKCRVRKRGSYAP